MAINEDNAISEILKFAKEYDINIIPKKYNNIEFHLDLLIPKYIEIKHLLQILKIVRTNRGKALELSFDKPFLILSITFNSDNP